MGNRKMSVTALLNLRRAIERFKKELQFFEDRYGESDNFTEEVRTVRLRATYLDGIVEARLNKFTNNLIEKGSK